MLNEIVENIFSLSHFSSFQLINVVKLTCINSDFICLENFGINGHLKNLAIKITKLHLIKFHFHVKKFANTKKHFFSI